MDHGRILCDLRSEAEVLTRLHRDLTSKRSTIQELESPTRSTMPIPDVSGGPNSLTHSSSYSHVSFPASDSPTHLKRTSGAYSHEDPYSENKRLRVERQQLVDWGESLYKELEVVTKTKQALQRKLESEIEQKKILEDQHWQLVDKCTQLETAVRNQSSPETRMLVEKHKIATEENADLRKQLEAYAQEIDKLRAEEDEQAVSNRSSLKTERDSALRDTKTMEAQIDLLKESVSKMEEAVATEQKKSKTFSDGLKSAHVELDEVRSDLKRLEVEKGDLEEANLKLNEELKKSYAVQSTNDDSLRRYSSLVTKMQATLSSQNQDYHDTVFGFRSLIPPITCMCDTVEDQVSKMIEKSENKDLEKPHKATGAERKQIKKLLKERERLREQTEEDAKHLTDEIQRLTNIVEQLSRELRAKEEKPFKFGARGVPSRPKNCLKELKVIFGGTLLQKASFKSKGHKRMERYLQVSDGFLKWGKKQQKTSKSLPLESVRRIEYGTFNQAKVWNPDDQTERPYRCFSLYTAQRSYDFIAMTDNDCLCWVIGIGILTKSWSNADVLTRGGFLWRRAIMKLDIHCKRRNITRADLLLEAIQRVILLRPDLTVQWQRLQSERNGDPSMSSQSRSSKSR
eukprot:GHVL01011645.1.p2 GENE.GHVL01011645.1~~GHVL01011645.1.p2  ORF type:complete len:627 (-),score=99.76 GHVL01011645.1:4136-6016(-)